MIGLVLQSALSVRALQGACSGGEVCCASFSAVELDLPLLLSAGLLDAIAVVTCR